LDTRPAGSTSIDAGTASAARLFLAEVSLHYKLNSALLFGSRARRDHRPDSDADIAVILDGAPGQFLATKLALADIAYDVLLKTGILIQPLPVWQTEWEHPDRSASPGLLEKISHDGVPL
jgi:antitoxin ChpS